MRLTPFRARLSLGCFLLASGAMTANLLYLQDDSIVSKVARAKTERAKVRAEGERKRRLALDDKEHQRVIEADPRRSVIAQAQSVSISPQGSPAATRIGHFSPTSHALDRAAPVVAGDAELRMPDIVRGLQAQLHKRGYEPGTADGVMGLATRAAIMAYEHDQGLPLTAEPSEQLLAHMQGVAISKLAGNRPQRAGKQPNAEHLIRTTQQALTTLGYFAGRTDGQANEETVRAIREYEMDSGLIPSGRISAPLITRLTRTTSGARTSTAR